MSDGFPCVYYKKGFCKKFSVGGCTSYCGRESSCEYRVQSNADRIRAMTDEELAEWIYSGVSTDPCDYCKHNNLHCDGSPCRGKADAETIVAWLKKPYGGADHE